MLGIRSHDQEVFAYSCHKKEGHLRHHPQSAAAPRWNWSVANRHLRWNGSLVRIIETQEQFRQGSLARATRPNKRDTLPKRNSQFLKSVGQKGCKQMRLERAKRWRARAKSGWLLVQGPAWWCGCLTIPRAELGWLSPSWASRPRQTKDSMATAVRRRKPERPPIALPSSGYPDNARCRPRTGEQSRHNSVLQGAC
jgi:hypothetical protein